MNQNLLTTAEVAELFAVHPRTVRRWVKIGKIKPANLPDATHYKFHREELITELIRANRVLDKAEIESLPSGSIIESNHVGLLAVRMRWTFYSGPDWCVPGSHAMWWTVEELLKAVTNNDIWHLVRYGDPIRLSTKGDRS